MEVGKKMIGTKFFIAQCRGLIEIIKSHEKTQPSNQIVNVLEKIKALEEQYDKLSSADLISNTTHLNDQTKKSIEKEEKIILKEIEEIINETSDSKENTPSTSSLSPSENKIINEAVEKAVNEALKSGKNVRDVIKKTEKELAIQIQAVREKEEEKIRINDPAQNKNSAPSIVLSEIEEAKKIITKLLEDNEKNQGKALPLPPDRSYSMKEFSSISKKIKSCVPKLAKLEKLIHLQSKISLHSRPLAYAKNYKKADNLHDTIKQIGDEARLYLHGLEINWRSFTIKEKDEINKNRSFLIKNLSKLLDLEKAFYKPKEHSFAKHGSQNSVTDNRLEGLEKFHGRWLMFKENLEKEEGIIHEWLLLVNRISVHDKDYLLNNATRAIHYLEEYHRHSEWLSFYKKTFKHAIHSAQSPEKINHYEQIMNLHELLIDKMRDLSHKIYSIFGNQIEEARAMIDKGEIPQPSWEETNKHFDDVLEKILRSSLKDTSLDELLDDKEILSFRLKECDFYLSDLSLPSNTKEKYQQTLALIKATYEKVQAEINQRAKND